MKLKLPKPLTFETSARFRCKGGKPPSGLPFCFRVKGEGTGYDKRHVIEYRVGKRVVGYQGPACTFVAIRSATHEWDSINAFAADWQARNCLIEGSVRNRRPLFESQTNAKAAIQALLIAAKHHAGEKKPVKKSVRKRK